MINIVKTSAQLGDRDDRKAPRRPAGAQEPAPSPSPAPQPDVRLVIEHDPARDVLVYRLIDRTTGEVISELSRDDLARMSQDPAYMAGAVISTKA